ncbi:hypothetical protein [Limnohabitans sp.]|uniref:hypothetical protein n=1 Tax=Limnohabitans sp. TaxID=1907725 RepID=UPI002FDD5DCC
MNLIKKLLVLSFMLICMQTFANELSLDLQKTCTNEQLTAHKSVKGNSFQADDFRGYCKCEAGFILEKATPDQLDQFNKNKNSTPNWLKQLKSKALNICVEKGRGITT